MRDEAIRKLEWEGVTPKAFRIWDRKHNRWFQGDTSEHARLHLTDCINFFGEIMIMEGTLFDQNEDSAWKDDPTIHSALDLLEWLVVVQDTGLRSDSNQAVFEGDIVITDDNQLGYVVFDKIAECYVIVNPDDNTTTVTTINGCCIKGNIFENWGEWFGEDASEGVINVRQ